MDYELRLLSLTKHELRICNRQFAISKFFIDTFTKNVLTIQLPIYRDNNHTKRESNLQITKSKIKKFENYCPILLIPFWNCADGASAY